MKKTISLILIVFFAVVLTGFPQTGTAQMTAVEVVEKMDNRDDGDTVNSDTLMVLLDKNNKKRIRTIKNIRKDYGKDSKGIIFFLSPADVRNTAYMSFDFDSIEKEDDTWLYLPALQKVKRIASSDKSGSFMGSDFSYSDINGIAIDDWDYTFARENSLSKGKDTWVVQGIPKPNTRERVLDETGYLKTMMWIKKDNFMLVKAKYWVQKGKKIKYFQASEIKKIDNIWTACEMTMITTSRGKVEHTSLLKFSNIHYNTPIKDTYFTTRSMERGL